ncbi:glycosyltransferase family 2 protein [Candidatus Woesearchaeota archaeon]|nr:glycosyltransferase family 2 protein [Candidatus Woesearchaeota archaeon]
MKVFIVIPAYNEAGKIRRVLLKLKKNSYKNIIVVDDGSKDCTAKIAEESGAYVLKHVINRGQGAALKTGIDYALEKKADIIVTFDADDQFMVKEIKDIICPVAKGEVDIALGSRFLGKAVNIPFLKKMVLKLGIFVVFLLYGINITDSQGGFRAMSRKASQRINLTADRMEHAAEFFSEIMRNKLKYREVPITVRYDTYALKKGQNWSDSFGLGMKMLFNKYMR